MNAGSMCRRNAARNGVSESVEFLEGDAAVLVPLVAPVERREGEESDEHTDRTWQCHFGEADQPVVPFGAREHADPAAHRDQVGRRDGSSSGHWVLLIERQVDLQHVDSRFAEEPEFAHFTDQLRREASFPPALPNDGNHTLVHEPPSREKVLALKDYLSRRNVTALFLDDRTSEINDLQLHSVPHGVVVLERGRHTGAKPGRVVRREGTESRDAVK